MPRQARIKYDFGTFHVIQHGGGCRKLFLDNHDREKFLSILLSTQRNFNFILHGYCLINEDSYDIILDVNGGDLSKIMKSINISYSMYAKCEGKLFSDRFKSTYLETDDMIQDAKSLIQQQKPGQLDTRHYNICYETGSIPSDVFLDLEDCNNCIKCMDTAKYKLAQIAHDKGLSIDTLILDKAIRNQLIINFRKSSTLSLKSLGELFGGLSESTISKIINTTESF